jgi:hypothetical protein
LRAAGANRDENLRGHGGYLASTRGPCPAIVTAT